MLAMRRLLLDLDLGVVLDSLDVRVALQRGDGVVGELDAVWASQSTMVIADEG